ncbi:MAG: hypothetical protein JW894_04395 [Bacteroidales bacterium]|nr:hypothetical protein [Bacteroidales bacterium]
MDKILKYLIYEEHKLIIEFASGKIDLIDFIELKKSEISDPRYNPNYDFIVDIRNADIEVLNNVEVEISKYVDFAKSTPNLLSNRKSALITNTPLQVVAMTLYKYFGSLPMRLEIFTTYEAALNWLGRNDFKVDTTELMI